jgi:hypothetical protein
LVLGGIARDPVVLPVVVKGFAAPQACEHLEPLVEHGPAHPRVRLLAQVVVLVGHRADADDGKVGKATQSELNEDQDRVLRAFNDVAEGEQPSNG